MTARPRHWQPPYQPPISGNDEPYRRTRQWVRSIYRPMPPKQKAEKNERRTWHWLRTAATSRGWFDDWWTGKTYHERQDRARKLARRKS